MSPVGGSRHYAGKGLGEIGLWGCPSCGEDNTGPITQGCVHCGAGRPAVKVEAPPPAPVLETPPEDTYDAHQGDVADYWAETHAGVTIAEAYRAGYLDGVRAARTAGVAAAAPPPAPTPLLSDPRSWRTLATALELFRDQVLMFRPEEVEKGEWLTPTEASTLVAELQNLLARGDH